ncbi:MAG: hypothetical protein PHF87_02890 [Desulfotomaculaceae bacterium]|nr:hypothetical protein [Desulfotomaculaceae bacterium]
MERLGVVKENTYLYGKRTATIYRFKNGVRIIGFKQGDYFDLRVLTIGFNPSREGLGQCALKLVRPLFRAISVNEINEGALPFWKKMKERGLVNNLGTVKWEGHYDHMIS